jgi:hypothetical protein
MNNRLLPSSFDNNFDGHPASLWLFGLITTVTLGRSLTHIFLPDGGAQSIATVPLSQYSSRRRKLSNKCLCVMGFIPTTDSNSDVNCSITLSQHDSFVVFTFDWRVRWQNMYRYFQTVRNAPDASGSYRQFSHIGRFTSRLVAFAQDQAMWLKTSSVSDRDGSPADIKIKQRYLLQSIDAPSGVDWS